jgi:hypothetical protein
VPLGSNTFPIASITVGTDSPFVTAAIGLASSRRRRVAAIDTTSGSIVHRSGADADIAAGPSISKSASVLVATIRGGTGPSDPPLVIAGSGHLREATEHRLPHPGRHPIESVRDGPPLFGRQGSPPSRVGRRGRSHGRPRGRRGLDFGRRRASIHGVG